MKKTKSSKFKTVSRGAGTIRKKTVCGIPDQQLPARIESVARLEDMLSEPPGYLPGIFSSLDGDIIVLGAAGKMGPTLATMAVRASVMAGKPRRITAVSRFSDASSRAKIEKAGVSTVKGDLLDRDFVRSLPDAPNVIYMAGMKFGATGNESLTWAMNTHLPALVCEKYAAGRIVAFSTGNVYGMVPVLSGGSVEGDTPNPVGEYAMSCLGRERIFEHFSRVNGTPVSLIRLNYACELRYGVLVDLALNIRAGRPVNTAMSAFNVIWQADASAMALASLFYAGSPPFILNVAGPETIGIRAAGEKLGRLIGKSPKFEGEEAADALLSNGMRGHRIFGYPRVGAEQLMLWVADWVRRSGPTLGKPTHFEARDGKF